MDVKHYIELSCSMIDFFDWGFEFENEVEEN